jgi:hypothetical protein
MVCEDRAEHPLPSVGGHPVPSVHKYAASTMASALWLSVAVAVLVLGLVTLVVLLRPWPAGGAGLLLAVGGWFSLLLVQGANRCAADAACHLGDNTPQNATAACFVLIRVVLSAYVIWTQTRGATSVAR